MCECKKNNVIFNYINHLLLTNYILVKKCPGVTECNEHGICNNVTGTCQCDILYHGISCDGKE
jgi:hypothetical protein